MTESTTFLLCAEFPVHNLWIVERHIDETRQAAMQELVVHL